MIKKVLICFFCFQFYIETSLAQLKYLVEDFESLATGQLNENKLGFFTYGNLAAQVDEKQSTGTGYSGNRLLQITLGSKNESLGWGIGVGLYVDLIPHTDYFNFYFKSQVSGAKSQLIKVNIKDDDDENGKYDENKDDNWCSTVSIFSDDQWHLISIPLINFEDENFGGDGSFNINNKDGRLLVINVEFFNVKKTELHQPCFFDFICFSKGILPTIKSSFEPIKSDEQDYCLLGAWTDEGKKGDFLKIASSFESNFQKQSNEKLDIIHFFHAFSVTQGNLNSNLLSSNMLNEMLSRGYTPMVTFETKFVNAGKHFTQPSLNDILNGSFDYLFVKWAKSIKEAQGIVLVRFFHEFNGDWYPWSVSNNGKNPKILIKAFRHIHAIFKKEAAFNARFIWCPNSLSKPQAPWNNILDAYPGDEYVDFVGVDAYNGAGDESRILWRSFRKELTLSYFLLTSNYPTKPILICETACRERSFDKQEDSEKKAEWIFQMSEALMSDFHKIRLISWFDERNYFKINSSAESTKSFLSNIWLNPYFQKGKKLDVR